MSRAQRRQQDRAEAFRHKLDGALIAIINGTVIGLPLVPQYTPRRKEHRAEGLIIYPQRVVAEVTGPIRNAV